MSLVTFKAIIDGVHFDPKKGAVKITLIGASHVSLDQLTTLSSKDESIQVTLESEQTKIAVFPLVPTEQDPATTDATGIDEEEAEWLKKAADKLEEPTEVVGVTGDLPEGAPEAADKDIEV